jgi:hypothetical protein
VTSDDQGCPDNPWSRAPARAMAARSDLPTFLRASVSCWANKRQASCLLARFPESQKSRRGESLRALQALLASSRLHFIRQCRAQLRVVPETIRRQCQALLRTCTSSIGFPQGSMMNEPFWIPLPAAPSITSKKICTPRARRSDIAFSMSSTCIQR